MDRWLLDRVFQKTVDDHELDPKTAMWSCHRMHAVGLLSTLLIGIVMRTPHFMTLNPFVFVLPSTGLLVAAFWIWMSGIVLKRPYVEFAIPMDGSYYRVLTLCLTICLTGMWGMAMLNGKTTPVGATVIGAFCASWFFSVASFYLQSCRKPPARRRDGARSIRYSAT